MVVEKFHWPDQSFNCASLSEPADVLIGQDANQCSIVGFPVSAVRTSFTLLPRGERTKEKDQYKFEVDVDHVPQEANYAHSELAIVKNKTRLLNGERGKVPNTARNQIAARIASAAVLEPSP